MTRSARGRTPVTIADLIGPDLADQLRAAARRRKRSRRKAARRRTDRDAASHDEKSEP